MRSLFWVLCFAWLAVGCSRPPAVQLPWVTDWKSAREQSKVSGKPLLVNFTGSDWCGYCIALRRGVFETPEFRDWSQKRVILVEIDFPRRHSLAPELAKQNQLLAQNYEIEGFPTIVLVDPKGRTLGRLGYSDAGPRVWIQDAEKLLPAARP